MDSIRRSINRHVIQTLVSSLSPGDEVPHDESILRSIEATTHHVQVDAKIKVEEKKVADIEQPDELSMSAVAVAVQQPKNSLPEEIPSGGGIPSGRVDDNDTTDVEAFRRLRCRPQTTRHPFFSNTLLLGLSIVRVMLSLEIFYALRPVDRRPFLPKTVLLCCRTDEKEFSFDFPMFLVEGIQFDAADIERPKKAGAVPSVRSV